MGRTDNWIILFQTVISASKEIKQVTPGSYYAGDVGLGLTSLRQKGVMEASLRGSHLGGEMNEGKDSATCCFEGAGILANEQ